MLLRVTVKFDVSVSSPTSLLNLPMTINNTVGNVHKFIVPTLLLIKIPRLSRTTKTFFQHSVIAQQVKPIY